MQFMAIDMHVKNVQACNGYEDIFLSLMADYRAGLAPELEFLAQMPIPNARVWVCQAVEDYLVLNEEDAKAYPIVEPREVVRRIRQVRKVRNTAKKQIRAMNLI